MYAHICYDSQPNCRRDGDLLVGTSAMGSGNKPAGLSKIVSRISVCTYTCVQVSCVYEQCMYTDYDSLPNAE